MFQAGNKKKMAALNEILKPRFVKRFLIEEKNSYEDLVKEIKNQFSGVRGCSLGSVKNLQEEGAAYTWTFNVINTYHALLLTLLLFVEVRQILTSSRQSSMKQSGFTQIIMMMTSIKYINCFRNVYRCFIIIHYFMSKNQLKLIKLKDRESYALNF